MTARWTDEQRQQVCDWLRQHGVDPGRVPEETTFEYDVLPRRWTITVCAVDGTGQVLIPLQREPLSFTEEEPWPLHTRPQSPPQPNILDQIDDAIAERCACGCGRRLRSSGPSAWYANQECQWRHQQQNVNDPLDVYSRPDPCWLRPLFATMLAARDRETAAIRASQVRQEQTRRVVLEALDPQQPMLSDLSVPTASRHVVAPVHLTLADLDAAMDLTPFLVGPLFLTEKESEFNRDAAAYQYAIRLALRESHAALRNVTQA